ncbi:hypothetical protein NC653_010168 [Populus alba x Populus x berolinensis]|uniref:Uncharacterized protein n=1 Tax=Populus alba x Populus x berolinensis TaxID=444605 RepID=A0AAD6W5F4_9ROSI|nr:hypothetical protein NC653_010168 [Populus alba x Populus x berolinensis]
MVQVPPSYITTWAMALVHRHTGSLHKGNLLSTSFTLQTYWGKSFFHPRRIPILKLTMTVKRSNCLLLQPQGTTGL